MSVQIKNWTSDANVSNNRHQELVDAINESKETYPAGELEVLASPSGRTVNDTRRFIIFDRRIAQINNSFGFTDARYRLTVLRIMMGDDGGVTADIGENLNLEFEKDEDNFPEGGDDGTGDGTSGSAPVGAAITAINIAEMRDTSLPLDSSNGTHFLEEDGSEIVEVFCVYDREDPLTPHWFFSRKAPESKLVFLVQSGGANGTASSAATWTYHATLTMGGAHLPGGPFSYAGNRPFGNTMKATRGEMKCEKDGSYTLWSFDERIVRKPCPT